MNRILTYKGKWWILGFAAIALLLLIGLSFIVHPARAEVFVYGSEYNYSEVMLPNNSYVHQGENITQGNWYDLSGVYGFSGKLAHWTHDDDVGFGDPDLIIELNSNPHHLTEVTAEKFPEGRYFQWEGRTCDSAGLCSAFGRGNAYVFHVSPPLVSVQEKTIVHTSNITISQNGDQVQIPVTFTEIQTYIGTPVPTSTIGASGTILVITPEPTEEIVEQPLVMDAQDRNGIPINGGVAAIPVTARAPVPVVVPVIAVLGVLIAMRRKE